MSLQLPFPREGTTNHANIAGETQTMLETSSTPVLFSSRRCRKVHLITATAALLALAGSIIFMARGGAANITRQPALSLEHVSGSNDNISFVLNKTGTGCNNTMDITIMRRTVSRGKEECAKWCRALVNCKQFNYNPNAPADNCVLFKDWCGQGPSEWELYDDLGGKVTNDASISGFDAHWTVEGNNDWWIWDDGRRGGCPRDSFECPVGGVQDMVGAGPPAPELWEAAFGTAVTGRREPGEHCCEEDAGPRLFAVARLAPSGLGSRMNNFANEALYAMWAGIPLSLCTPDSIHDSWADFFEPVDFARCSECGQETVFASGACAGAYASLSLDEDTLGDMKRFVYSQLYKFKPEVLKRRAALLKGLGLAGVPYIGVHIRRGDKNIETKEAYIDVRLFAQQVRQHCSAGHGCKVYVASDWPAARDELQGQLPEMVVVAQDRLPSELYNIRNDPWEDLTAKAQAETSFLLDLSVLIQSEVFVGTSSSNVGRFVHFMRPKNKTSISLDKGGSYLALNC